MLKKILNEYNISDHSVTPHNNELFSVSNESELLCNTEKEKFHSLVAKLLFISRQIRYDIHTAISFLTTRVMQPNSIDNDKLFRVLKYLNKYPDLAICYKGGGIFKPIVYVDASYACHQDMTSRTGVLVTCNGGIIYGSSRKQSLVSRSSSEAELIAVDDALSISLFINNLCSEININISPIEIHEDNKSCLNMINTGKSLDLRTNHIAVKYYFVKQFVDNGSIVMKFCRTEDMFADFLTKPLMGKNFKKFINDLFKINRIT